MAALDVHVVAPGGAEHTQVPGRAGPVISADGGPVWHGGQIGQDLACAGHGGRWRVVHR